VSILPSSGNSYAGRPSAVSISGAPVGATLATRRGGYVTVRMSATSAGGPVLNRLRTTTPVQWYGNARSDEHSLPTREDRHGDLLRGSTTRLQKASEHSVAKASAKRRATTEHRRRSPLLRHEVCRTSRCEV